MQDFRAKAITLIRSQRIWITLFTSLAGILLLAYCIFVVIAAFAKATYFDGYAADGPFQLYNPLRRLAEGQLAGYDFPFFHGIGVPLLHYLPFELLGGNIFASEASRWIVSPFLFLLSCFTFFWAALRSWKKSLIATGLALIFALTYIDVVYPSNSLIGIRTVFPIFAASALLWNNQRKLHFWKFTIALRHLVAIIFLVAAFLCGTEQGLAAIAAYVALRAITLFRSVPKWQAFHQLLLEGTVLGTLLLLALTIATGGHPWSAIHYGLIDIPQEQAWYFGSPPNSFLTWDNLIPMMTTKAMWYVYAIIVPVAALFIVLAKQRVIPRNHIGAYCFLFLYGLLTCVSMLGYFAPTGQLIPLMRVALVVGIALIFSIVMSEATWKFFVKGWPKHKDIASKTLWLSTPLVALALVISFVQNIDQTIRSTTDSFRIVTTLKLANQYRNASDYTASNPDWKFRIDSFKPYIKPGATVWSTYANLYESNADILHPSEKGYDYIIHALGEKNREEYQKQFVHDKPEYVITLRPSYFPYEEWLWSKTPAFYEQLLTNYTIVAENGSHYLWKYTPDKNKPSSWRTIKQAKDSTYHLPKNTSSKTRLYEVKVQYDASSTLPVKKANSLPRYMIDPKGTGLQYAITLPHYEHEWIFIVPIEPGQRNPRFDTSVKGLLPGSLNITNVQYRGIHTSPLNLRVFENNFCTKPVYVKETFCKNLKTDPLPAEEAAKPVNARVPD